VDAVVLAEGEDEGGPFGELGVVCCEVGLAGEERWKVVFAGEGEWGDLPRRGLTHGLGVSHLPRFLSV